MKSTKHIPQPLFFKNINKAIPLQNRDQSLCCWITTKAIKNRKIIVKGSQWYLYSYFAKALSVYIYVTLQPEMSQVSTQL